MKTPPSLFRIPIAVPINGATLSGELTYLENARGLVIFAHDTIGSRRCPCNTRVAAALNAVGIGTLLFDLLSEVETAEDELRSRLAADTPFLAGRLVTATRWILTDPLYRPFRLGYCGACAGGAASLVAASWLGNAVKAVVVRATRVDSVDGALERVTAPSLFIVGERNVEGMREDNERAMGRMRCKCELAVVAGANDLLLEPVAQTNVAELAAAWFDRHLPPP